MGEPIYIGLMSGTSVDSLDAIAARFKPHFHILGRHTEDMPQTLKEQILSLATPGDNELVRMAHVDAGIAQLSALAVNKLLDSQHLSPCDITAIGSHGQTIRHLPELGTSLQVGDPNLIAELTGITTIADFRRRDMAAKGQGAPLVPAFHKSLFSSTDHSKIILNIGGIANMTWLPANQSTVIGFDTGPGNMLMDAWIQRHHAQPYDESGKWAASGTQHQPLLTQLLSHRFFTVNVPKSTGREDFNLDWLDTEIAKVPGQIAANDVQATLLTLTATSIISAIRPYFSDDTQLYVCGGGAHNRELMTSFKKALGASRVHTTSALDLDPNWVEAAAFAWLAKQHMEKKAGNLTDVTGAIGQRILGGCYPA